MYDQELDQQLRALGKSQISHALMRNHMDEVRGLLQEGITFDAKHEPNLLAIVAIQGHGEGVELLIEQGYDPNFKDEVGRTALHETRDPYTAEVLLKHGANINEQDSYGNTALHNDMGLISEEMTSFLIDQGADVLMTNVAGMTPLDMAIRVSGAIDNQGVVNLLRNQETKVAILGALNEAIPHQIYHDEEDRQEQMHTDMSFHEQQFREERKQRRRM